MKALKIVTLVLATIALGQTATADKLCLQTTVNKKTFKATNKSVVAATCPKGYTELADTSSFQGAAGAQGAAGIVNLSACRAVSQRCDHAAGNNSCSASCNTGEFVLQFTASTTSDVPGGGCSVNYETNGYSPFYSNGLGAGVVHYAGAACNHTSFVGVLCCPTS